MKKDKQHREKMELRKMKREEELKQKQHHSNRRNEMDRRLETLNVIYQLKQNNISSDYLAIRELLEKLTEYVTYGEPMKFTIDFPEMNKVIHGTLPIYKDEECVVVMKHKE